MLRVLKPLLLSYILSTRYSAFRYRESSELRLYKDMSYKLLYRVRFIIPRSLFLELSISCVFLNSAIPFSKEKGLFFFNFLSYSFPLA
jgi:hypothetical protein